jgi:hypothetical protein
VYTGLEGALEKLLVAKNIGYIQESEGSGKVVKIKRHFSKR